MGLGHICLDGYRSSVVNGLLRAKGKTKDAFSYLLYFIVNPPYIGVSPPAWVDSHDPSFTSPALGPEQNEREYFYVFLQGVQPILSALLEIPKAREKLLSVPDYSPLLLLKLKMVENSIKDNRVYTFLHAEILKMIANIESPVPPELPLEKPTRGHFGTHPDLLVNIHALAAAGKTNKLDKALAKCPMRVSEICNGGEYGKTVLHYAVENGHLETVKLLLEKYNSDVEERGGTGRY